MDITTVILIALAPSLLVLAAGICRATWVWWLETASETRPGPSARRSRV